MVLLACSMTLALRLYICISTSFAAERRIIVGPRSIPLNLLIPRAIAYASRYVMWQRVWHPLHAINQLPLIIKRNLCLIESHYLTRESREARCHSYIRTDCTKLFVLQSQLDYSWDRGSNLTLTRDLTRSRDSYVIGILLYWYIAPLVETDQPLYK